MCPSGRTSGRRDVPRVTIHDLAAAIRPPCGSDFSRDERRRNTRCPGQLLGTPTAPVIRSAAWQCCASGFIATAPNGSRQARPNHRSGRWTSGSKRYAQRPVPCRRLREQVIRQLPDQGNAGAAPGHAVAAPARPGTRTAHRTAVVPRVSHRCRAVRIGLISLAPFRRLRFADRTLPMPFFPAARPPRAAAIRGLAARGATAAHARAVDGRGTLWPTLEFHRARAVDAAGHCAGLPQRAAT